MASLISVKGKYLFAKQGVLNHSHLATIWAQWPTPIHQQLLQVLERFCVLHQLRESDGSITRSLVPCLLPEVTIAPTWPLLRETADVQWFLERHYVFKFVPLGVLTIVLFQLFYVFAEIIDLRMVPALADQIDAVHAAQHSHPIREKLCHVCVGQQTPARRPLL